MSVPSEAAPFVARDLVPRIGFWRLMFVMIAAPIFWIGQEMLGYGFASWSCFPSIAPRPTPYWTWMGTALVVFNAVALIVAAVALVTAFVTWQTARQVRGDNAAIMLVDNRICFLSIWGMASSGLFFGAIVYATIISLTVPICAS
jgi:hypothetical protein